MDTDKITPAPATRQAEPPIGDPFALASPAPDESFPTPWRATISQVFDSGPFVQFASADGKWPFNICALRTGKALADRIVLAMNAHAALVTAAKQAVMESADLVGSSLLSSETHEALNAAIELAGGWTPDEQAKLESLALGENVPVPDMESKAEARHEYELDQEEGRRDAALAVEEEAIAFDPEEP